MRTSLIALLALTTLSPALAAPAGCPFANKRGLFDTGASGNNAVTAPLDLVNGLLGSVAAAVDLDNRRPDAAHPFVAPGPTDQRGPCPGLNALANHGYLDHSGIVTAGEVMQAVSEGFNMATDLSLLLVVVAIVFDGNPVTETFSLGGEDERTYSNDGPGSKAGGRQWGLDGHSRCEGDISPTRDDFYTHEGDNHSGNPARFITFMKKAAQNGGQFNVDAVNQLYAANAAESLANNPHLFFQGYTAAVTLGAYPFLPNYFSNGTYGAGGDSNLESLSSLMGYNVDTKTGQVCYQPERFPENWYRRATPYGAIDFLANLAPTYLTAGANPLLNPLSILENGAQVNEIGCDIFQGITSGIPAAFLGAANDYISTRVTYAQSALLAGVQPLYGCDTKGTPQASANASGIYQTAGYQETAAGGGQKYSCSTGSGLAPAPVPAISLRPKLA